MGKFEGVSGIDFDCKVAVLTMKAGAAELKQEAVTSAITAKGWGVKEFTAGVAEPWTVHSFQLTGTKPEDHPALAKRLATEIKGAKEVVIDTSGRAVVTLAKDGELTEASLAASLKAANEAWKATGFETKEVPKTMATYVVEVPAMAGAEAAAKVRETLKGLKKVLFVQVFEDTKTAQIRLNEPCDKIAAEVTEALKAKGVESKTALVPATKEAPKEEPKAR